MSLRSALRGRWRAVLARLRPAPGAAPNRLRRGRFLVAAAAVTAAGLGTLDVWLLTCGFDGCPTPEEIRAYRPSEGERVYDRNDRYLGRLTSVRRVNVSLSSVPLHVRRAFIATEDRRFYKHHGVDWRGAARAFVRNVAAFGVREGSSTITMQLARNTFIAHRAHTGRSFARKLLELRLSNLIEEALPKDSILELYLNAIYLGNGVYGVEAASRDLFKKSVKELTVAEGAMLAALPKGPSAYTPKHDRTRALARRDLVLALMHREGYLSQSSLARARRDKLVVSRDSWFPPATNDSYALDAVRAVVDSVLRATGEDVQNLKVYTTIDVTAQTAAERAVRRRVAAIEDVVARDDYWSGDGEEGGSPSGRLEGAAVAIDPRTGDIRALVGGRSYTRGAFNRALRARRQPGSAFKPFVYAAALANGMTPASLVDDEPVEVALGNDIWAPANYGGEYEGRVTLRRALMRSSNAAAVRVSRAVGERQVVDVAHRSGIRSPIAVVPAVALGAADITPLELVAAYAPFSNGGYRVVPRIVRRIERGDGTVLWTNEPAREVVMDPRDAYQLTSMLRSVVDEGTGSAVRAAGITGPVAGKTGTTNNGTDVWFVGYTPTVVAGFWFGFDTPRSLGHDASGGRLAAPAWAQFYREGWKERGGEDAWSPPDDMVMRVIDADTGELAGDWCPNARREWFKPGTEPTHYCSEHAEPEDEYWEIEIPRDIDSRVQRIIRKLLRRR